MNNDITETEALRLEGVALDLARWDAECKEAGL